MKIEIHAYGFDLTSNLDEYAQKKMLKLQRFIPLLDLTQTHFDIQLREIKSSGGKKYQCEVALTINQWQSVAKETTTNMFASIDIVGAKLKSDLAQQYQYLASEQQNYSSRVIRWLKGQGETL